MTLFGVPAPALFGQLLLGLINGSFYALLSLGLALIFGLLNIVNFCHGAFYMLGAVASWLLLSHLGLGYWSALLLAPLLVGLFGAVVERLLLARLRGLDPLNGMLLTFGLALALEGGLKQIYGSLRTALRRATRTGRRLGVGFHVSTLLSRLGGRPVAGPVSRDLVCRGAHAARRAHSRGDGKPCPG